MLMGMVVYCDTAGNDPIHITYIYIYRERELGKMSIMSIVGSMYVYDCIYIYCRVWYSSVFPMFMGITRCSMV